MTDPEQPERNCPQGHIVPDPLQECPVCGETVVEIEDQQAKGRSLWELMGQNDSPKQTDPDPPGPPGPPDPTPTADDEETEGEASDEEAETAETERPKGLWGVMQHDDAGPGADDEQQPPEMPEADPVELDEATAEDASEEDASEEGASEEDEADEEDDWDEDESDAGPDESAGASSKSCGISLTAGIIATLLAGLGLVPPVIWTSLPALVAGLVAVYTGLVGIGETSSKGLGGRGKAMVGIALGTLGMFLPRMLQMLF